MSEQALNDVFRPRAVKKRVRKDGTGFRGYAVRRLRQMVLSWCVMAGLGVGANYAFQVYAQEKYGIGLEEQLAALDRLSGGALGLSDLAGGTETRPAPGATAMPRVMPGSSPGLSDAPQATREIIGAGALVVRVPQVKD